MHIYPIVIVEDDKNDCGLLNVFKDIGVKNPFKCFKSPLPAIEYVRTTTEQPLIIISDINMPGMNGLAFREVDNEDKIISKKKIPFVFLSTAKENSLIEKAFHRSVPGLHK